MAIHFIAFTKTNYSLNTDNSNLLGGIEQGWSYSGTRSVKGRISKKITGGELKKVSVNGEFALSKVKLFISNKMT